MRYRCKSCGEQIRKNYYYGRHSKCREDGHDIDCDKKEKNKQRDKEKTIRNR